MATEKLSYEIAAIYSASPEVKRAIDDFAKINTTGAKVRQQLNSMTTVSAKTGEQFRKTRVNTAQLGIQINQLGTQIASGTNIGMAFTQQIGDIGYAMSNAGGKVGAFGRLLSGPVGFAIGGLVMALGPAISEMMGLGEEAETSGDKIDILRSLQETATMSTNALKRANEALAESFGEVGQTAIQAANATISQARATIAAQQGQIATLTQLRDGYEEMMLAGQGGAETALAFTRADTRLEALEKTVATAQAAIGLATIEIDKLTFGMDANGRVAEQIQQNINNLTRSAVAIAAALGEDSDAFKANRQAILQQRQMLAGLEAQQKSTTDSTRELTNATGEQESPIELVRKGMSDLTQAYQDGEISILAYAQGSRELLRVLDQLQEVSSPQRSMRETLENLFPTAESIRQMGQDAVQTAQEVVQEGLMLEIKPEHQQALDESAQRIRDFYAEWGSAQEAIGMTVSNAFQGMLTGAMSWKDGMKSIIQSVIAELWKLFVVQQIVGFVKGLIPGATDVTGGGKVMGTSGGLKMFANGGYIKQGQPSIVGERGPEMFVPGASGTIIPNHNMGRSGGGTSVTVNVDARGSSDPAMVREQAQRAVLEAAPAIIQAAESRTINRIKRPTLGGVIQ